MSPSETPVTESADGAINLETTMDQGHPETIVRDDHGQLVFPASVPQAIQSPTSPEPNCNESPPAGLANPVPEPFPRQDTSEAEPRRPQLGEKFVTETLRIPPRPRRKSSVFLPPIKRAGTNVSLLQQALWMRDEMRDDDDNASSNSDSSTDADDDDGDDDGDDDEHELDAHAVRSHQTAGPASQPQPSRTSRFRKFKVGNENYKTTGKLSKDGRLAISVKDLSHTGYLTKALGAAVSKVVPLKSDSAEPGQAEDERPTTARASSNTILSPESLQCPRLNIVIMIIGSRGDAQPFLKIGRVLKEKYGHRVRIATHPAFRDFVEKDSGLEFFSVGGDPSELMAFMVKNPGMIPTLETVRKGDIGRRRDAMADMFGGFWRACVNVTDDEKDTRDLKMMGDKQPFIADLIVANPVSFAHVHCAEALGIPLILSFTFPYTPTKAFPHPLARIKKTNVDPGYANFMSYPLVEMMVWQGLGDLVNDLRVKTLGLDPVSTLWAPGALYRMKVPFGYLWSPSLNPKPADWGEETDICGFVFLDLANSFTPPDPLADFLDAGETPIYIGFGSIVVDDAKEFTHMIFKGAKLAGVRALVSKGWGGFGGDSLEVPENIFLLDNTPHDWLFPKVRACVIHGGAGTTAIALKCGKPTMVVPFFGDQFFWGEMVAEAKAGPKPVPYKQLSAENLAEGIKYCLTKEAQANAHSLASSIELEGDGAENMCAFIHQHLQLSGKHSMRCSILEERVAVWWMKGTRLRLSALAADILVEEGLIQWRKLRLVRHCEWNDFEGPGEPVTGVLGSVAGTCGNVFAGIGGVPARLVKASQKRRERKARRRVKLEQAKVMGRSKSSGNGTATATRSTSTLQTAEASHDSGHGTEEAARLALSAVTTGASAPEPWYVNEVSRGALQSAGALASAPIDLSVALAQGFHNAPRLYGDDTVRRPTRVTGIRSGLRAARAEFLYSIYDAWTGVVRLPMRGAKQGVGGFTKGVGMGLTGFVLKDISAVIGPVGYTLKGVKKQIEKRRQPYKHVRRARILQGQQEKAELGDDERRHQVAAVERGWEVLRSLWATVEQREKAKGGLRAQFSACKKRGVGQAYESVEMAAAALAEVQRGGTVTAAVREYRASAELGRRSLDGARRSQEGRGTSTERKRVEVKRSDVSAPIAEGDESV